MELRRFCFQDQIYRVKAGSVLRIPVGTKHGIKALTELHIIEVQTGSELIEEDITRICMTWEEVKSRCSYVSE